LETVDCGAAPERLGRSFENFADDLARVQVVDRALRHDWRPIAQALQSDNLFGIA